MQPGNVGVVAFGTATTLVAERVSWGAASVVPLGRSTNWLPSVARPGQVVTWLATPGSIN